MFSGGGQQGKSDDEQRLRRLGIIMRCHTLSSRCNAAIDWPQLKEGGEELD